MGTSATNRRDSHQTAPSISTLHEYLELVNREADSDAMPPSLFRGQQQDWPLLPKLARLHEGKRLKGNFLDVERSMLDEFKRQARVYVTSDHTDWDWLALWFAVQQEAHDNQSGVVWIFSPSKKDYVDSSSNTSPYQLRSTRVLQPRHSNMRLRVQAGRFTVHFFRESDKRFIPLEKNSSYKPRLKKLEIASSAFAQIRCDLDRCGINAGTMFPDVTGLAQHVEWQFSFLGDEQEVRTTQTKGRSR